MKASVAIILLGLSGAALFLMALGPRVIDPTYVDWLLGPGDWGTHYLGWASFRKAPWTLPLGYNPMLLWPVGTSIVYTDSLPLLAIPLKLFDGILPADFQFNGPWMLSAWVLQPVMAWVLLRQLSVDRLTAFVGALLFLTIPSMTARIGHDTLVAQWILLWALVAFTQTRTVRTDLHFFAVLAVAVLVHFYLFFMVAVLWAAWILPDLLRPMTVREAAASLGRVLATPVAIAGLMWLGGYFVIALDNAADGGFGYYSMNLNAPINPISEHWSTLLPTRPVGPGQYEGFQYLGVGIIALLLVAAALFAMNFMDFWRHTTLDSRPIWQRRRWWLLAALTGLSTLALSTTVTWDETVLFTYALPETLTGMVRSSGRLWWPVALSALAGAVVLLYRVLPRRWAIAILLGCLALQWVDLRNALIAGPLSVDTSTRLEDPRWDALISASRVVSILPPSYRETDLLYPLTHRTARLSTPITSAYVARRDPDQQAAADARLLEAIVNGNLDPDTLYIAANSPALALLPADHASRLGSLEGLLVLPPRDYAGPALQPAPVFPFDHVGVLEAPSLAGLVASCRTACSLLLAVKDEASTNLPDEFIQEMTRRGSRISELGWRQSYAAVLHDGNLVAEEIGRDGPVSISIHLEGVPMSIDSLGANSGNLASIEAASRQLAFNRRGFNLVRIDWARRVVEIGVVDVYAGQGG